MQDFDWAVDQWNKYLPLFESFVKDASTNWQQRRPLPSADDERAILQIFQSEIPEQGIDLSTLRQKIGDLIKHSGYNGHPSFLAYITSSPDPAGILGDMLAAALNQNTNISHISPAASSIEMDLIRWFTELVGWDQQSGGVFSSGGQFANIIALAAARNAAYPNIRENGWFEVKQRPVVYVSDQAHYCHAQALELLGLGSNCLRKISSDNCYRISIAELRKAIVQDIAEGRRPLAVIANAGSVGTGSVDPIRALHAVCCEFKLWFHIDGAYGVPALLSDYACDDLKSVHLADSIAFDPHKWMYSPLGAGVTLVKNKHHLTQTFSFNPVYLEKKESNEGICDFIDYTPENSRPFRALKVWLGLQIHGFAAYRRSINRNIEIIRHLAAVVEGFTQLEITAGPNLSIVCWKFVPERELSLAATNQLHLDVIQQISDQGIGAISKAQMLDGSVVFRACCVNFRTQKSDVEKIVEATQTLSIAWIKQQG